MKNTKQERNSCIRIAEVLGDFICVEDVERAENAREVETVRCVDGVSDVESVKMIENVKEVGDVTCVMEQRDMETI